MMLGRPFVAMPSNSHKIQGMLEDAGLSDLLMGDMDKNGFPGCIWDTRHGLLCDQYVTKAKSDILNLFNEIKRISLKN